MSLRPPTVIDNNVQLVVVYKYYDNLPPDVLEHHCNNKRIITGTKAIPDGIAMGVGVDSMNISDRVEFDAPHASDLTETMAKRLLEGIPLT